MCKEILLKMVVTAPPQPQNLQCTCKIYTFVMKITQYQLDSELPWMAHKGDKSTHKKALKALIEMCHQNVNMFSLKKKKKSLWKLVYIGFGVNIPVFQLIETIGYFIYQCSLDLLPSAVYC